MMQVMSGGTRRSWCPEGEGNKVKEVGANVMAANVARFCWLQHKQGIYFSIESPLTSHLWKYGPVSALLDVGIDADFHQSMCGLQPPHSSSARSPRIRKATRIRTNLGGLSELTVTCDRKHDHFHCLGHVKVEGKSVSVARAAGRYPQALTSAWVRAARSDLVKESTSAYHKGKTRVRPLIVHPLRGCAKLECERSPQQQGPARPA